jgi:hypothetical protein
VKPPWNAPERLHDNDQAEIAAVPEPQMCPSIAGRESGFERMIRRLIYPLFLTVVFGE